MKKVIYTLSFAALAATASAQVVSSTKIYVSEGAILSVGQDFENKGELINKGDLHLRQNLTNEGDIRSEGNVTFDGYTKQEVKGTQNVQLAKATIENDVELSTPMIIGQEINYNQGVVSSSETNPLVFAAAANHYGASDYSHSVGTVTKVEADQFEFPLGDGSNYRGFKANSQKRSNLSAAYVSQNPTEFSGQLANGVESINHQEYWVLKSDNEEEAADVKLINTYEDNVAYLKRSTWTLAENRTLNKATGLDKGVRFTSGRGKFVQKDIGVWPNPTQGAFNLKLAGMNDTDDVMIDVTNQDGRVVLSMEGRVAELRKVYELPSSLVTTELTVRVINGDDVLTEKLILNR
ncbi:hypothetical protein [Jiulongibacter sp. NS-SX5]|uniref:hypothetical protein n=1 Tax=Jiulongibacter sp. NS-SX5 TaxID=3463854 RepID=UPI00405856C6